MNPYQPNHLKTTDDMITELGNRRWAGLRGNYNHRRVCATRIRNLETELASRGLTAKAIAAIN